MRMLQYCYWVGFLCSLLVDSSPLMAPPKLMKPDGVSVTAHNPTEHNLMEERKLVPSLNFIFIPEKKLDETKTEFVFDTFRRITFETWRHRLAKWRELNPGAEIVFWTDKKLTEDHIFDRSKIFLSHENIQLHDLWTLPVVVAHPIVLDPSKHIALRADLVRALVLDAAIQSGPEYSFYADLDVIPMHVSLTENIQTFGFGLGDPSLPSDYGNSKRYENSVLILMKRGQERHADYILKVGIEYLEAGFSAADKMAEGFLPHFSDNDKDSYPVMMDKWLDIFSKAVEKTESRQTIFGLYKLLLTSTALNLKREGLNVFSRFSTINPDRLPIIFAKKDPRDVDLYPQ